VHQDALLRPAINQNKHSNNVLMHLLHRAVDLKMIEMSPGKRTTKSQPKAKSNQINSLTAAIADPPNVGINK